MPDAVPSGARDGRGAGAANVPRRVARGDTGTRGPWRPAGAPARPRRPAVAVVALLVVAAAAAFSLPAAASAASAAPTRPGGPIVRLAGSITPALAARARRSGTPIAASTRLHLTVALRPRDPGALAAYANAVSTPGSRLYRHYLSARAFGHRFGASDAQLRSVRAAFARRGLTLGRTAAGRLSIPLLADVGTIERGLDVRLRRVPGSGGRSVVAATRAPALAAGAAAAAVQSIVGLQSSSEPRPLAQRPPVDGPLTRPLAATTPPTASGGTPIATTPPGAMPGSATPGVSTSAGPRPCAKATKARGDFGGYTDDELAAAYGFTGLYAAGDEGKGTTIAVYELEPNSRADIAAFEACYGIDTSISYIRVDGGAGHGIGTDEAAFDIENVIGFAPAAKVLVYQGRNAQSGAPGSAPFDTLAAIVNQDRAQVVSVSWGGCESQLGRANARAENALFAQAAVQGQSIVAANGDSGAQDCQSPKHRNARGLAVDDPASQPWVTGVGGTTLQGTSPAVYETAWNSRHESAGAPSTAGATGGGVSSFWAMPPSQSHAAASLGVLSSAASGSHCGRKHGYCREVPDVSIDGDPRTGYVAYFNGDGTVHGARTGWQVLGGTSGAAPVWAALLALADSAPACHGRPIGFANPALYRAASDAYRRDFHDVQLGNNAFAAARGFSAKRGYDPVTGLGSPNATRLVTSLCADTLTVDAVTPKQTPVGKQVSLRMRGSDVRGAWLRWSATGLPPKLRIDKRSGRITGKTKRAGRFVVRATARDGQNATATVRFVWTITKAAS